MSRKRGNGEGSITKRKDGRWMARYTIHTATGPKRKTVYGRTRAEAATKLAKTIAERDGGVAFDASKMTFGEYLNLWLNDSVRDSVKERTLLTYEQIVRRHLSSKLGNVSLKKLTAAHLQSLYRAKLDEGLSAQTVLGIHSVARKALGQALRWELVAKNPAAAAKPPRPRAEEVTPLSREEAWHLLMTAKAETNRLEALYILALGTGLRHGELLGLRWGDIRQFANGSGGELMVRRTLGRARAVREGGKGHAFGSPKTGKARVVRFGPGIATALHAHKKRQLEERVLFGPSYEDTDQVFTSEGGGLLYPWRSTRAFNGLLKRAGLKGFRFHDLRHTAATLALLEGVPAKVVQEMLGHAKISQTIDTYSHVLPTMQAEAARKLDSLLF